MAEDRSPWARADTLVEVPAAAAAPAGADAPEPATAPAPTARSGTRGPTGAVLTPAQRSISVAAAPRSRGGAVTRTTDPPPPDVIEFGPPDDPVQRNKRLLAW